MNKFNLILLLLPVIYSCKKDKCSDGRVSSKFTPVPDKYQDWTHNTFGILDTVKFTSAQGAERLYVLFKHSEGVDISPLECEENIFETGSKQQVTGVNHLFNFSSSFQYDWNTDKALLIVNTGTDNVTIDLNNPSANQNYLYYTLHANGAVSWYDKVHHTTSITSSDTSSQRMTEFKIAEKEGLVEYKTAGNVVWSRVK